MTAPGIRNTEWVVWRPGAPAALVGPPGIHARFRGRDGRLFYLFLPMVEELLEDIESGQIRGVGLLEMAWQEFRRHLDRRYDDPYVFWPDGIGEGRWAA